MKWVVCWKVARLSAYLDRPFPREDSSAAENADFRRTVFFNIPNRSVRRTTGPLTLSAAEEKKGKFGESLDFAEEGLYDVFWALVVAVRERLCHEFLVYGRDVRHVVAGRQDLSLVRRRSEEHTSELQSLRTIS